MIDELLSDKTGLGFSKLRQIIDHPVFGMYMLKLEPTLSNTSETDAEPQLQNRLCNQVRLMMPFRMSEKVFDKASKTGWRQRVVGMFSFQSRDEFSGSVVVNKPTWVMILRGAKQGVSGHLSNYTSDVDGAGQASFTPITVLPDQEDADPEKIVS